MPEKGGRPRIDDRTTFQGILFVLHTGIQWKFLPQELRFGSGMTCWRWLRDWHEADVWTRLQQVLLATPRGADQLDCSRSVVDAFHVRAMRGGPKQGRAR
ncbi:transposase [Saccharopolyspora gloriosae]|uniref:Transposase n=1 Tax=Saccharopolyspora gloriosae TaxID=455344 RepID=A0A840NLQ3_9PSEU|nr:transposase [Saccharopolyspora gloriosae]